MPEFEVVTHEVDRVRRFYNVVAESEEEAVGLVTRVLKRERDADDSPIVLVGDVPIDSMFEMIVKVSPSDTVTTAISSLVHELESAETDLDRAMPLMSTALDKQRGAQLLVGVHGRLVRIKEELDKIKATSPTGPDHPAITSFKERLTADASRLMREGFGFDETTTQRMNEGI